jgi:hypothetical protein
MSTVTFDTLKFADHLRGAGVPEAQAKAMSDAQKELLTEIFDQKRLSSRLLKLKLS